MTSQTLVALGSQQADQRNSEVIDLLFWMLENEPEQGWLAGQRKAVFATHDTHCTCAYHAALAHYTHYKIKLHRLTKKIGEYTSCSPFDNGLRDQIAYAVEQAAKWKKEKDSCLLVEDRTPWIERWYA